ncbi:MAG: aldo/keto reductase [Bryobacterales bacterium]|nr:aldo/keto reductase [Bryobacterales bacterium]
MINRRHFVAAGLAAGGCATVVLPVKGAQLRRANDVVLLGPDNVRLSRMAMGTGTFSGKIQRALGIQGLADMLHYGYDEGLTFFDTSDTYQTHPHVKEALTRLPREKIVIMTKCRAQTAKEMRADLDRFRQELGVDYFDIVLLHSVTAPNWSEQRAGAMEALAEARENKLVRTYGCSIHSLEALKTAVNTPWLRVALVQINPIGVRMVADPATVIAEMRNLKAAGKGVIGMKILGEGAMADRVDQALRHAVSLDCMDCFTIGPANRDELSQLIKGVTAASEAVNAG